MLTIVFAVAALWVSPRRRRTLLQMVGAAAFVVVLVRRAAFTLQDMLTRIAQGGDIAEAAAAADAAIEAQLNG